MGPGQNVTPGAGISEDIESDIRKAPDKATALKLALLEAENALKLVQLAKDHDAKQIARTKANTLLTRAEFIKKTGRWRDISPSPPNDSAHRSRVEKLASTSSIPSSTRSLSKTEQIIILKSSYVNGGKFPPWQRDPDDTEFDRGTDGALYTDPTIFDLSITQQAALDGWKRPQEALPPPTWQSHGRPRPAPTMIPSTDADFVQDAASDCSVVASLCAGAARVGRGHRRLMTKSLFPFDEIKDVPRKSNNGKYVSRLNFNGAFRKVEVDDRLPVSKTDRVIHVLDRNNPGLVWPALIEKLYLKVRGGYDFPGSDSATDLWVLTGWIPEQVFLHNEDLSINELWQRIWSKHQEGDVIITLGTGKMSQETEKQVGLASEHDYAVLDLREETGQNLVLVKNPWCEGSAWTGSKLRRPSKSNPLEDDSVLSSRDLLNANSHLSAGTFWIDMSNITQYFASMYLNWNPGRFRYRQDIHFAWDLTKVHTSCTFSHHPQFTCRLSRGGPAWLLMCRHFSPEKAESQASAFINLSIYDNNHGYRVLLKEQAMERIPLVDSMQCLMRLSDLQPGRNYTVVPDEDDLPGTNPRFTLSAFATSAIYLENANDSLAFKTLVGGSWTEMTAGGNASSPLFSCNPQYSLTLGVPSKVSVLLDTADRSLAVNVKICFGGSGRLQTIRNRDILADSKQYRAGSALALIPKLDPGTYTIICSTFEVGQTGRFELRVDSETPCSLKLIPGQGAGRHRTSIEAVCFGEDEQAYAILLLPQRMTKFFALVRQRRNSFITEQQTERSLIRVSVLQGSNFQHLVLSTSLEGEYSDSLGGARTDEIDLNPSFSRNADIWLVIERNFTAKSLEEETFSVDFFTESKDAVQTGDWQRWEE